MHFQFVDTLIIFNSKKMSESIIEKFISFPPFPKKPIKAEFKDNWLYENIIGDIFIIIITVLSLICMCVYMYINTEGCGQWTNL